MLDTRREVFRQWGKLEFNSGWALLKFFGCLALAAVVALLPAYAGLTESPLRFCTGPFPAEEGPV